MLDWVGCTAIFPSRLACSLPTLNLRRRCRVEMFDLVILPCGGAPIVRSLCGTVAKFYHDRQRLLDGRHVH